MQEQSIFIEALEIAGASERSAFLDRICAGNVELRQRMDKLLKHHEASGSAVDSSAGTIPGIDDAPDLPGMVIGPYKLLQQIGEGGMGVVWMAQQTHPVQRKVALKIIKPGMDSKQVIARFEAERQALALMDHPNIAKVLDAGTVGKDERIRMKDETQTSVASGSSFILHPSSLGRPYFVMELVKGVPITQYCDEHRLTPRQRLELFLPVAQAVQHAHQKGIIHRDLKPSNVLVAEYDDKPVAKIIDFGVAKAVGTKLTESTLFTAFGAVIGTLEYMSPEQAKFNALDIDTRSDIYSLGVLLYELLTGTTPLSRDRLKTAAFDECLRIIREEEPQKPSTRLSQARSAERGARSALARPASAGSAPDAELRAPRLYELDWIVMKCLEKDRNRRYDTANGLASDLQRYLADEPVTACPPSAGYRLRKYARRNKGAVLAITAILLLFVAGITGTTWGLLRAEHARGVAEAAVLSERAAKEAEAEQRTRAIAAAEKASREAAVAGAINDFLNNDILRLSSPTGQVSQGVSPDANLKLRTVLQRAAKRIDGKFPNEPEVEMRIRYTIGFALQSVGDNAGALAQYEKVAAHSRKLLGHDHAYTLNAEYRLACMHRQLGRMDIALPLLEENVERHKTILGEGHAQTFVAMNGLAMTYRAAGQPDKAMQLAERTLELRKQHLGPTHTDTLVSMNNLASTYFQQKDVAKALPLFEETLARMKTKLAALHPERLNTTRNLAQVYHAAEQIDKAIPLQEMLVGQFKTAYGVDDPGTQKCIDDLITYYVDLGRCDEATTLLTSIQSGGNNRPAATDQRQAAREKRHRDLIQRVRPAADAYRQELAAKNSDHADTLAARRALALALRDQKRLSAAAYHLKAVLDTQRRLLGAGHADTQAVGLELGTTRVLQGRFAEAEPLLLEVYEGVKKHETSVPGTKGRLTGALERLVQLYAGWDKKEKAAEWRTKLEEDK